MRSALEIEGQAPRDGSLQGMRVNVEILSFLGPVEDVRRSRLFGTFSVWFREALALRYAELFRAMVHWPAFFVRQHWGVANLRFLSASVKRNAQFELVLWLPGNPKVFTDSAGQCEWIAERRRAI